MTMRVIIAYDGSEGAQAALDDLGRAGLGNNVEATIVSVAEFFLPPPETSLGIEEPFPAYTPPEVISARKTAMHRLEQMHSVANDAKTRIQTAFPYWKISTEVCGGSPWWEVISKAHELKSDVIVVGSHGRSALRRLFLGSVSQKILAEAQCSVRVGRTPVNAGPSARLLLVGVDGSPGSQAAVNEVARREWPSGVRTYVISIEEPSVPTDLSGLTAQVAKWIRESEGAPRQWRKKIVEAAAEHLRNTGLDASAEVKEGTAKEVLVEEANRLRADCIFVGSSGFTNRFERFLLGSVSSAVTNRAECPVEVVRPRAEDPDAGISEEVRILGGKNGK